MNLKRQKKGESVTETGRGNVTEEGSENLTDGSMIVTVTETETGTGIEIENAEGTDLAAESGNVEKNAPETGTEIGTRTEREIENDAIGVEVEKGGRTGKTINMIHPEKMTMTKSNGFMHLHMLNICM